MRISLRLAIFATVLFVGGIARATPARVVGLGDMAEYVDDDTNVLLYPSLIAKYAHFAYLDFGSSSNGISPSMNEIQIGGGPNAAAYVRLGGDFQIGVLTSDFVPTEEAAFLGHVAGYLLTNGALNPMSAATGNASSLGALAGLGPLRRYDIILGYGSVKSFAAGLRISYGQTDQTSTAPTGATIIDPATMKTNEAQTSDYQAMTQFRLQLGTTVNFGDGAFMDVAIDYTNFGAEYLKNGQPTFTGGGGNAFGIDARFRFPISRFWTLIPQIQYRYWGFSMTEDWTIPGFGTGAGDTASVALDFDPSNTNQNREQLTHSMSQNYINLGLAGELKAAKNATFWLAIGFDIYQTGTSDTDQDSNLMINTGAVTSTLTTGLPYIKFGGELAPFDFWKVRLGAEKYVFDVNYNETDTNQNAKSPVPVTVTFGNNSSSPGPMYASADLNLYAGTSFVIPYGIGVDFLLLNNIFTGNFKSGFAGRASLSYKF